MRRHGVKIELWDNLRKLVNPAETGARGPEELIAASRV